jgi:hypothetical protein
MRLLGIGRVLGAAHIALAVRALVSLGGHCGCLSEIAVPSIAVLDTSVLLLDKESFEKGLVFDSLVAVLHLNEALGL